MGRQSYNALDGNNLQYVQVLMFIVGLVYTSIVDLSPHNYF